MSIAAVEQVTGIARATLRIWERRYGFPQPGRDERGERAYPADQVRKLRQVAGLMAQGHRPGHLVQLGSEELAALEQPPGDAAGDGATKSALADAVLAPLRDHDPAALLALLEEAIRTEGLGGFVTGEMPRMNVAVGDAWSCGALQVYEEHLYTETVQQLLRTRIAQLPRPPDGRPRVLLATFPEESHGLGLLMAQAVLALEGCDCTSLGVRVPVAEIVTASAAFRADIVGLSFSASANPARVLRGLEQLRAALQPSVALWCGGSSPVVARRRVAGVHYVQHVREVPAMLAQWRVAQTVAA